MKQILSLLLLFVLTCTFVVFAPFAPPASAAGGACCTSSYLYDSSTKQCLPLYENPDGTWPPPVPIACTGGEVCIGSGAGVCTLTGGGGNCCTSSYLYDPATKQCLPLYENPDGTWPPPVPIACTGGAWCSGNTCVLGSTPTPKPLPTGSGGPTIEPYNPECTGSAGPGIKTALGCLPTEVNKLFLTLSGAKILVWAIGLGAGTAFLLGLYGAFLISTSSGDPEKVQAGKELITSVILGLIVIMSSIFILRIVTGSALLGLF